MSHSSYIVLQKKALENNLSFIKSNLKKDTILSSVVKGNAYGHGIEHYIPIAEHLGINHFSVYNINEAKRVYNALKTNATILIMGYIPINELEWCIHNNIEFFVYDIERLKETKEIANRIQKKALVHIEVETGLNRTGIEFNKIEEIAEILNNNRNCIFPKGICSHLAGAESISNYVRIKQQIIKFKKAISKFNLHDISFEQKHLACSAAIIHYPETQFDLVRVGILQYGLWPSKETLMYFHSKNETHTDPLKRVISWKSKIISIKAIKSGEFIGYGLNYMAERDMLIALVPVGYSDGYSRSLSNQGRVLVNGKRANVIGVVNMNSFTIDITEVSDVFINDEVVLIGRQGNEEVSIASFSELSNLLNYELLTRIPSDIPRYIE
jgi:alanine racemase